MGLTIRTTRGITVKDERLCVLHDARGEVFHVHHHSSLHSELRDAPVEQAARQACEAAALRRELPELHALMVPPADYNPEKTYRVDVRRGRLEEVPTDEAPVG